MFSNKLLKVYFTKFLGILGSILSVTIVLPYISSDVEAYGVYSVVISLIMIVNFADLGFLGAGQKYAAEYSALPKKTPIQWRKVKHAGILGASLYFK